MVIALLIGAVIGVGGYLTACLFAWKAPEIVSCVEVILLGAGIPSGGHLVYCSFAPDHLVHIVHEDGKRFDLASKELTVQLGEYHAVEVFMGGFAGTFFCIVAVISIWKKPFRQVTDPPANQQTANGE